MEREYYLTDKPNRYTNHDVVKFISDNGVRFKTRTTITSHMKLTQSMAAMENVKRDIVAQMARDALESGKVRVTTHNDPIFNETIIETEMIVMSQDDLYKLLTTFGITIQMKP